MFEVTGNPGQGLTIKSGDNLFTTNGLDSYGGMRQWHTITVNGIKYSLLFIRLPVSPFINNNSLSSPNNLYGMYLGTFEGGENPRGETPIIGYWYQVV